MASSSSLLLCVFTLFYLFVLASSSRDNLPATITVPLTPIFTRDPSIDPILFLRQLASASLSRAQHLKYGKKSPLIQTPLFPVGDGGHTITLSFGTPPQKISFLVDTGSSVVWFPCTTHYVCTNCSSNGDPKKIPIFKPKLSSSYKILGCKSPKCVLQCPRRNGKSKRRSSQVCPPYRIQYGVGESAGFFLLEKLTFPEITIHDFLVGCSTRSARIPADIALAGFGRAVFSLPIQMGVKKFAYCLKSHAFDDTSKSSKLIFDYRDGETKGLSYAPILKKPASHYYLGVKDIMIGEKPLKIPHKYLAPGANGTGGVVIDSGFTYGYMSKPVFKTVTAELKKQMARYRRSKEAEKESGFTPCYNFTGEKSIKIPDLVYKFTSGANMVVAGKNYLISFPEHGLSCFPTSTDEGTDTLEITPVRPFFWATICIWIITWSMTWKITVLDSENKLVSLQLPWRRQS